MDFLSFLPISDLASWTYLTLFLSMFVEGNFTVLTATFLLAQGKLSPAAIIFAVALGAYMEQWLLFYIGHKLGSSSSLSKVINKLVAPYDKHILNNTGHSLIISKFVYGMHRAIIIRAGMLRMDFKKFFGASFFATTFWLLIIGSLGFGFGQSYKGLNEHLAYAELAVLGFLILFISGQLLVSKYLKKDI